MPKLQSFFSRFSFLNTTSAVSSLAFVRSELNTMKLLTSAALLNIIGSSIAASNCTSESLHAPSIYGVKVLDIAANEVHNYTEFSLPPGTIDLKRYTIDFCNITLTYEHPGWADQVAVNIWLPLSGWNGRVQALGGGGYSASYGPIYLTQSVAAGFATIATNSGHVANVVTQNSLKWALLSSFNLNLPLIEDWGYKTLGELATFGKAISAEYYGRQPEYSYFSGCSGGGRQAMALAQRYPEAFDGILAVAPAMCK